MKISSTLLIVRNENAKHTGKIFLIYHCWPPLVGENMGKERSKVADLAISISNTEREEEGGKKKGGNANE